MIKPDYTHFTDIADSSYSINRNLPPAYYQINQFTDPVGSPVPVSPLGRYISPIARCYNPMYSTDNLHQIPLDSKRLSLPPNLDYLTMETNDTGNDSDTMVEDMASSYNEHDEEPLPYYGMLSDTQLDTYSDGKHPEYVEIPNGAGLYPSRSSSLVFSKIGLLGPPKARRHDILHVMKWHKRNPTVDTSQLIMRYPETALPTLQLRSHMLDDRVQNKRGLLLRRIKGHANAGEDSVPELE